VAASEPEGIRTLPQPIETASLALALFDRYQRNEMKDYYGVMSIYALARMADDRNDESILNQVEAMLRRFPDEIDHPAYNFPSYRIGGIAQSFVMSQGRMIDRRALLREYAEEMMGAPRDEAGILTLINDSGNLIWIDAAMAATPFLLFAGQALGERRYVKEAVNQAVLMYDEFLDSQNGLLHQCKNFIGPGIRSEDHWSRGNGWGYFALAELLRGLASEDPLREEVEWRFTDLSEALLPHQSPRGLWRQEIPLSSAWEESSGTGLILYGIGVGVSSGVLKGSRWMSALQRGIRGLARYCINLDYSIENSCPGTLCPGSGAAKGTVEAYLTSAAPYRDEPHGCAPLILALSMADLAGLSSLALRPTVQSTPFLSDEADGQVDDNA